MLATHLSKVEDKIRAGRPYRILSGCLWLSGMFSVSPDPKFPPLQIVQKAQPEPLPMHLYRSHSRAFPRDNAPPRRMMTVFVSR